MELCVYAEFMPSRERPFKGVDKLDARLPAAQQTALLRTACAQTAGWWPARAGGCGLPPAQVDLHCLGRRHRLAFGPTP